MRWKVATLMAVVLALVVSIGVMLQHADNTIRIDPLASSTPGVSALIWTGQVDAITAGPIKNEEQAAIYYPTENTSDAPVVFIQHGGHAPCLSADQQWPCKDPNHRTSSYLGYSYLAEALAKSGFVVVSISANATVAAANIADSAAVFNHWVGILEAANATNGGPLQKRLTGAVNLSKISLIGHSRGGDAVEHYGADNAALPPVKPIAAMVLLAPVVPVDYYGTGKISGSTVPALVVTGTCDGDAGNDGEKFMPSLTSPSSRLVQLKGANHNFYNSKWTPGEGVPGAIDDATEPKDLPGCEADSHSRLTRDAQRTKAVELVLPFLKQHQQ